MVDKFNIEDYIKSEEFYNFIYNDCCNEVNTSKIINIPNYKRRYFKRRFRRCLSNGNF